MLTLHAVDFANQTLAMQHKIDDLEMEVARLRRIEEDFEDLLRASCAHNEKVLGNLLQLAMTPGVLEATTDARDQRKQPQGETQC